MFRDLQNVIYTVSSAASHVCNPVDSSIQSESFPCQEPSVTVHYGGRGRGQGTHCLHRDTTCGQTYQGEYSIRVRCKDADSDEDDVGSADGDGNGF